MENKKNNSEKSNGNGTAIAKKEMTQSERFTAMVIKQFTTSAGNLKLTSFQEKLCQNYFIKLDQVLKEAEQKRMKKSEQYREPLDIIWNNVNMEKLSIDVVAFAGVGLDPTQPNHISMIPFKDTATNKYNIGFIPGYRGKEIKSRKYGLEVPDDVVVELVYANDLFKQFKKDINNRVEKYQFEVKNNFNRGNLVGGFYYHVFYDRPEKNKLRVFSKADIDKRKPDYASVEFWGGEKDVWKNGQKTGEKEIVEGWYDEMAYKTIYSAAWGSITIDSEKIDDHYVAVMQKEREPIDARVISEIKQNANVGESIGFEEVKENKQITQNSSENPEHVHAEEIKEEEKQPATTGPGF